MSIESGNVSGSVFPQYGNSSSAPASTDNLGKEDFLQLLVTQLNNQNPLDPQDNGEFVAQLAQFSSLESLQNLNGTLDSLVSSYQSSQALQASSLVGRSVIVESASALVDTSESFSGVVSMPMAGKDVGIRIYDGNGTLVNTLALGDQARGNVDFIWDGTDDKGDTVEPGTYRFVAEAAIDGASIALRTYLPATVNSVTLSQDGGEMSLNLAGAGSVSLSQVQTIAK